MREIFRNDISKELIQELDKLEQRPVAFCQHGLMPQDVQETLRKTEGFLGNNEIERRRIALLYRIEKKNGGLDASPFDQTLLSSLEGIAARWKEGQHVFQEPYLTRSDFRRLMEASQYPKFVTLFLENIDLQEKFLCWTLRDKLSPRVFIEYPATAEKISASFISNRVGRLGGALLKIQKVQRQKILTLPFEGKDQNILDDSAFITFRGQYKIMIRDVFRQIANKRHDPGRIEYFSSGFENWNGNLLGFWNEEEKDYKVINLNAERFWEQLPVLETLSQGEVEDRYHVQVDGKNWVASAVASREKACLDYERNHAFLEVAIPNGRGRYNVYQFGKLMMQFPKSRFEELTTWGRYVPATIAHPDETTFFTFRKLGYYGFSLETPLALRLMDSIREDMIRARTGNIAYQIQTENCAAWIQDKLESILGKDQVPNLFRMSLFDTEPDSFVSTLMSAIKKLPEQWQAKVFSKTMIPFGAFQGVWVEENGERVHKCLTEHRFWDTMEIYLPAYLIKQREEGHFRAYKSPFGDKYAAVRLSDKMMMEDQAREKAEFMKTLVRKGSWGEVLPSFARSLQSFFDRASEREELRVSRVLLQLQT